MHKKRIFKNNEIYFKGDLTAFERIKEFAKTFWVIKKDLFLNHIDANRYFQNTTQTEWFVNSKPTLKSIEPIVTWIGHSSFLIQIGKINILTDPNFEKSAAFVFKRNFKPAINLVDLPKIDFILISHNHNDHMDFKSLKFLKKDCPVVLVPVGDKNRLLKLGFTNVIEKEWWQEEKGFDQIKFTFLPSIHWSGRNLWDINRSLWGSWMIDFEGFKIYFAGDSAYAGHFTDIANKFDSIDLAILPIGPEKPRDHVQAVHIGVEQAIQAFIDLKAKNFIPMHWGTFRYGADKFYEPIEKLRMHWGQNKDFLENKILHIPKFGQPVKFDFQARL